MTLLIKLFIDICLMRANPQDVPAARMLTVLTVTCYAVMSLAISLVVLPPAKALFLAVVNTSLLVALAVVSLWIVGKMERNAQTISALAGTGVILQVFALPIMLWLTGAGDTEESMLMLPHLGRLLLVIWNVIIISHILRHALSVALPITIGISVLYMYFTIRITSILFIAAG